MTIVRSAAYKNQQWYWRNHDAVDMTGDAPLGHSASAAASMSKVASAAPDLTGDAPLLHAKEMEAMPKAGRERIRLDQGWRFSLGNAADVSKDFGYGAMARERPFSKQGQFSKVTSEEFDDTSWRLVDLPHDWAVELPFDSTKPLPEQCGRPMGPEFPDTSIGWYRKSFNGHYLTRHLSGYAPLRVGVTDWMNYPGKDKDGKNSPGSNLIVVRCDVTIGAGWFYEGAGIYRHVWLSKQPPLHLVEDGSFAQTKQVNGATELKLLARSPMIAIRHGRRTSSGRRSTPKAK
jgi:beta-galactosidase